MNLLKQLTAKRIGPDLPATHWLLYFNFGHRIVVRKLAKCGKNVWLRPGCTLVDMDSIEIGDNVVIRPGVQIHANTANKASITIEKNVLIAPNVFITVNNHNYKDPDVPIMFQGGSSEAVIIREGSWLGANSIILKANIGKNSVVAAGAVVTKEVPDYCVVGGVPAKIISILKK
jgi:acetyltransferase-like isoleucine patch superfamily enzyme